MNQCLMIRTKDRRRFFTTEDNYDRIVEFSKVFNAEVAVVRIEEAEVLTLDNLAPAICNASYKPSVRPKYELVEVKVPLKARKLNDRQTILKTAGQIKEYVTKTFLTGDVVSLRELQKRFQKSGLSLSALCNHVARVRRELTKKGKRVVKVGAGKYAVKT